jgi:uncharacterized protein YaiI (UPF0178 family)
LGPAIQLQFLRYFALFPLLTCSRKIEARSQIMNEPFRIFVDADSCPVKEEVYKVARRQQIHVSVVSNSFLKVPEGQLIDRVLVGMEFDAADNFIAEKASKNSIIVTADILLADRCIKAGATVLAPNGVFFTPNSIGAAVATRALMEDLRAGGEQMGGPPPFQKSDRSRFLDSLHQAVVRLKRTGKIG